MAVIPGDCALISEARQVAVREHWSIVGYIEVVGARYVLPDGRVLLDDVNFRVGEGSKAALVGANGAGKTTLLRVISGDLSLQAGAWPAQAVSA